MQIQTIIDLRRASQELRKMVEHGKKQAARPDADKICRIGDETIAKYEETATAIDSLTEDFPDYTHYYSG